MADENQVRLYIACETREQSTSSNNWIISKPTERKIEIDVSDYFLEVHSASQLGMVFISRFGRIALRLSGKPATIFGESNSSLEVETINRYYARAHPDDTVCLDELVRSKLNPEHELVRITSVAVELRATVQIPSHNALHLKLAAPFW